MDKDSKGNDSEIRSIAKLIFFGEIDEDLLFPFPCFDSDQKEMARGMVESISKYAAANINAEKFDDDAQIPREVIKGVAELGLCGLAVPEKYGGLELDYQLYARVFAEIAKADGAIATMLGAHQSIGFRALLNEGSEEQKKKWLPKLASGESLAAFCLTEPSSGSDAYSIKTKAKKNGDGTYTINGQKIWITNANLAQFYTVFAKTEHKVNGEIKEKISCFIVESGQEGLSFGEKERKMGIRASETRAIFFDNVVVSPENIIGELGRGFKIAMNVLNTGRLSLAAACVGGMQEVAALAAKHAVGRKQFGKSISEFGLIQDKLAQINALIFASESIVYMTTGKMNDGMSDFSLESAIGKVFCSESLWKIIDHGMQIAGGNGYMKEYPYERMMRDARINLIFEGTNEILRCLICLSGIQAPSENLKELGKISDVSKVLADPIKSLGVLSGFAKRRLENIISTKTIAKICSELGELSLYFTSLLSEFSIVVENTLIKIQKKIIDQELVQKRIADTVIDLYVMICVLSRTNSILQNSEIQEKDKKYSLDLTKIILTDARYRIIGNLKTMKKNYDNVTLDVAKKTCEDEGYCLDAIDY